MPPTEDDHSMALTLADPENTVLSKYNYVYLFYYFGGGEGGTLKWKEEWRIEQLEVVHTFEDLSSLGEDYKTHQNCI